MLVVSLAAAIKASSDSNVLTLNSKCNVFKVMKSVFQGATLTMRMLFIIIISTNRAEIINVQDIKRGFMGG